MQIKDRPEFKNKPPAYILKEDELISTAIAVMAERNIGSVVIVDDDRRVRGIVTERDLLRRLLGAKLDQHTTKLSKIMTKDVKTASPDDQIIDWLRLMSNERFRHLPVVDADGRLINVLSQGDFVSYTWPELLLNLREKVSETFGGKIAPLPILMGAMVLYSIAVIVIMKVL